MTMLRERDPYTGFNRSRYPTNEVTSSLNPSPILSRSYREVPILFRTRWLTRSSLFQYFPCCPCCKQECLTSRLGTYIQSSNDAHSLTNSIRSDSLFHPALLFLYNYARYELYHKTARILCGSSGAPDAQQS